MSFNNILCYGTINPDLIYFVDKLPDLGGDIQSDDYKLRPGGTAINCAEKIKIWSDSFIEVRGNSIGSDPLGEYIINFLESQNIKHKNLVIEDVTPTCSIFVDSSGERTIVSSGYSKSKWSKFNNLERFDSIILDRYSVKYISEHLPNLSSNKNLFIIQAGYETHINYNLDFLIVSKDEISIQEANNLIDNEIVKYILLTASNLPARLISRDGAIEIIPPEFKTINATGAGDTTAAYIGAFGVNNLVSTIKNACAAGAIVAGTNEEPSLSKINEIAKLVEVKPR